MSDSYQTLQSTLDQAKAVLEVSPTESIEPRLAQVEAQMDTRYEQIQAQLTNLRFDFEATARQLREDVDRVPPKIFQVNGGNLPSSGNLEDENRLKWIESSLQHLNTSVYSDRAMLQKLDRRVSTLKRTLDIVAVAGFVSVIVLGLSVVIF